MHHPLRIPVRLTLLIAIVVAVSGCLPFLKKPPAINQIFTESSDTAFRIEVKDLPIHWETLMAKKAALESTLNRQNKESVLAILDTLQIDPDEIVTIAGCTYGLEEYLLTEEENRETPPEWICAIDIAHKMTAETMLTAINRGERFHLTAKATAKENGFELMDIHEEGGDILFTLALYTGQRSQIRIGSRESVLSSLNNIEDFSRVRTDMIRPEGQSWFFAKIPEEINDGLNEFETLLPFDPGTLVSGFATAVFSVEATGMTLESTLALEFENEDQANTAFSYIQLGLNFALKPYLRKKTEGQANHFIRSIQNENTGDLVKLSFSINADDVESLDALFDGTMPPILRTLLDLIKQP